MKTVAILAGVVAVAVAAGPTQGAMTMHARQEARPAKAALYAPGLGEIMSVQQMRHTKLWFAGSAGNWDLAGYELDELKEGFDDVLTYAPTHDGVALTALVKAVTGGPIPELAKAIAAHDSDKFVAGFDALSGGCNSCHQSAKHGFIVIQRPTRQPYTDQDFAPAGH